jgi:hypothetical protein
MIRKKAEKFLNREQNRYPLSGKIMCGNCGGHFRHKINSKKAVWQCSTYNAKGKEYCDNKMIPADIIDEIIGDEIVDKVIIHKDNKVEINGIIHKWQHHSRAESWTAEMRADASQKTIGRNEKNAVSRTESN